MPGRYDNLHTILTLDPARDYEQIVRLVGTLEYPWLIKKSLEFALFRTYAVPHTSEILAASGQFERHGQQRYDDTTLMLSGIAEHGIDSDYGRKAIRRMNQLHRRWNIDNTDYLYVLSTFVFEPTRWNERYGWRKPTEHEKLANFYFWREVGLRMGIQDIPDDMATFEQFNIDHERQNFRYHEANRIIGEATVHVFLNWYPALLRPLVFEGLKAFMDDPLLEAFGFTKPHSFIRWGLQTGLKLFGKLLRFMPPRRTPYLLTEQPNRTYPDGYNVEELGPRHVPPPQAAPDAEPDIPSG